MRGLALLLLGACYTGAPANRDVSLAWHGRTAGELEGRWGAPALHQGDVRVWSYSTTRIELPDARIDVHPVAAVAHVDGPGVSGTAVATGTALDVAWHPGEILRTRHDAAAFAPGGVIADVQGEALHWGPPNDVNLHWGTIFGAQVGMGRLANTPTPLPSGSLYIKPPTKVAKTPYILKVSEVVVGGFFNKYTALMKAFVTTYDIWRDTKTWRQRRALTNTLSRAAKGQPR